jgi:hypothetical protein
MRGISDGTVLLDEDAEVRDLALTRIRETGASVVRIPVNWAALVDADPPPDFDARDPASSAYNFARIDLAVRAAASAGLTPLLVVTHAPNFAEAPNPWLYAYPGSWAPNPAAVEAFAAALASRYDGSFPDPLALGRALPHVMLLQAWNEPNLARYLEPQWVVRHGRWSAFSPLLYRQILNAFYAGVKSVVPTDVVISAGVAPNGDPAGVGRMAPVTFLTDLLCLRVARSTCPQPPHFDVLAFHPLSVGDPDLPAVSSLSVSIADAAKVISLVRQAERQNTALPAGHKPVWVTELNWESDPPAAGGVPPRLQALWVSRALHRLWIAGIGLVDWQFLVDPYPGLFASNPLGGDVEYQRPAGLYSPGPGGELATAQPKPFLRGFTLPFDPLRVNRRNVRVWALLMSPGQPVLLQRLTRERVWRTIATLRANGQAVLNALVALRGAAELRLVSGTLSSASASVGRGRSSL